MESLKNAQNDKIENFAVSVDLAYSWIVLKSASYLHVYAPSTSLSRIQHLNM
jgi:hypothetical protein